MLNKRLEIGRQLYNACLGRALARYKHLRRNRTYQNLLNKLRRLNQKKELSATDKREKRQIYKQLNEMYKEHQLSEYALHKFVKPMQKHFKQHIDSQTAQKIATRAWNALESVIFRDGRKVHFHKYGNFNSIEGKSNKTGIRFRKNQIKWLGLNMSVKVRQSDIYAQEALQRKVKYCRILRKIINGKYKYYVQLVLTGKTPVKRHQDGTPKQQYGNSRVGIDPSLQSIAYVSEEKVKLQELASSISSMEREIALLQRKLDRSRRATNPHKYNSDGTINRENKDRWIRSRNYMRTVFKLKELNRKLSEVRKQEHSKLANHILSLGTEIYIEKTDFKALAKRAKETKKSNKTGKFLNKKRYGKSIGKKAPGAFFRILEQKLGYIGESIRYINPFSFKASQYNHIADTYDKKSLSQRWAKIGDYKIQRDLYSAFLIMNSKQDLQTTDRERCLQTFEQFVNLHDQEIKRLQNSNTVKLLSSFGIKRAA